MDRTFFEAVFPEISFDYSGDTQICCPFPHTLNGMEHFETNPSAGINISKGVFHCFGCDRAFSEISFAAAYLNTTYENASEIVRLIHESEDEDAWSPSVSVLWKNEEPMNLLKNLGFSKKACIDLKIGYKGEGITFPVIMFHQLLDEITYRPGQKPKYLKKKGSTNGLIYAYDLWKESTRPTIICAGEKDATIARSKGLNAISITGGELSIPHLFLNEFANKKVYIIYDNDDVGKSGARTLAMHLQSIAEDVKIVDLSETCIEKGGDLWDYFMIYEKTVDDLVKLLQTAPTYSYEEAKKQKDILYPLVSLHAATTVQYVGKTLRSNIQVVGTIDNTFLLPTLVTAHKKQLSPGDDANKLPLNWKNSWTLNEWNLKNMFYLIDSGLKENAIEKHIRESLLRIPPKEQFVEVKKEAKQPVYKCVITDISKATDKEPPTEFLCYSISNRLETGKKYLITYKLVPHPQDGQKLMLVVNDVEESDDFLHSFKLDEAKIASLKKFQVPKDSTLKTKFYDTVERVKGILNADYDENLITIVDLWYHSAFEFESGKFKNVRAALDVLLVGESRIGKSSTVELLQSVYEVGKIINLSGASATVAGIIGGSNKTSGGFQTRAGVIPQNHRGAIILEELGKSKQDLLKELTDLRSSGKARIVRVNGSIELPAVVRMLALTNAKSYQGNPRPIGSYPNGISVLLDLVGTAEDIARYDLIAIFGFNADKPIDPFFEPLQPYDKEDYQTRIRWIWSRSAEQIVIPKEIYEYVTKQSNKLNITYSSHIKLFGIEAWKKIVRLAISIAGYVCSTDETYEKIIVKPQHIDLAIEIMVSLYDNDIFRFKEFVQEERKLQDIDAEGLQELQKLYNRAPTLLLYLMNNSESTRTNLQITSGVDNETFNKIIHSLVKNLFIKIEGFSILPTGRFRKGMAKIDRTISVDTPGEVVIRFD